MTSITCSTCMRSRSCEPFFAEGLFFGYAVILWLSRTSEFSAARTAILAGSAIVTTVMAIVSLVGVLTGVVGPAVWSVVAMELLLAAGFVYFYVAAGRQGKPATE